MAKEGMKLVGKIAANILGMTLGRAIMGSGKKKNSLRLLMGIKKRKGYKRVCHPPVKLHRGKHRRRRHLKKRRWVHH